MRCNNLKKTYAKHERENGIEDNVVTNEKQVSCTSHRDEELKNRMIGEIKEFE